MKSSLVAFTPVEEFALRTAAENTQQTYRRIIKEFFHHVGNPAPQEVKPSHVLDFREALIKRKQKPATVNLKLAVVRSFFAYMVEAGKIPLNPASAKLVTPPALQDRVVGRVLEVDQVRRLLAAPHKDRVAGKRDYALLLVMLRLSLRVAEVASLRVSSLAYLKSGWVLTVKVKGGRERVLPMPGDVKRAIDDYLVEDRQRRRNLHSDGEAACIFQPLVNFRNLVFDKALSVRQIQKIVRKWSEYAGLKKVTPHDLRRTAITRALDMGIAYREIQMMSGHRDPKTVMKYDHHRTELERNPINLLNYD